LFCLSADDIAEFASKHRELVVYSTYQSLQAVVDAGVEFDLAICDEAHKTATARHNEFALVHEDELRVEKRLYMTATPRVLSPIAKGKLRQDPFEVFADMSDEETFGPEFHRMSFADAIEQGILVDYKIVVVGVSDRDVKKHIEKRTYLQDASADQVATSLALEKVMKKHGTAVRHSDSSIARTAPQHPCRGQPSRRRTPIVTRYS
jgi:predicted helicase